MFRRKKEPCKQPVGQRADTAVFRRAVVIEPLSLGVFNRYRPTVDGCILRLPVGMSCLPLIRSTSSPVAFRYRLFPRESRKTVR